MPGPNALHVFLTDSIYFWQYLEFILIVLEMLTGCLEKAIYKKRYLEKEEFEALDVEFHTNTEHLYHIPFIQGVYCHLQ